MADQLAQDRNMVPDSRAEFEAWAMQFNPQLLINFGNGPTLHYQMAYSGWDAATQRQQERIAQLEAEVGKLTTALFDCREAFPIPDQGSALESAWMGAMSEPDAVPEFVKAQVQALSLDAGRLDWLDDQNRRFRMGWRVGIAPAGNVSVGNVIELGSKAPPTTIRAAIDAATAAGKGT